MAWQSWLVLLAVGQAGGLTAKQQTDVGAAVAEYQQGGYLVVVHRLAPLLARDDLLAVVDEELRRQKLPGVGEVMAQARLEAVRDGQASKLPKPLRGEVLVLLPAYRQLLQEEMDRIISQGVMGDVLPVPDKLEGFQDLFWQLGVAEGRIDRLAQAASYLRTLGRGLPKAELEKLPDDLRAMVENDEASSLVSSLETLGRGVDERRIELSIKRLGVAMNVLSQQQLTTRHLAAAAVWNADLQRATAFLKKTQPKSLLRPALKEEGLLKRITADGDKIRRVAGPLTTKAGLLHDGLQCWLRGRFGAGPEIMGLVKSQQAVRTPEGRLQLQMPEKLDVPDPFGKPKTLSLFPFYHRRHLYTWSWSNRYVYTKGWTYERQFATNVTGPLRSPLSRPPLMGSVLDERSGYLQRWVSENENESLLRLVGYVEYAQALGRLETLLRTSTEAELAVMDQWVKDQHELAIYINLSRKFPQMATTAFAEWPQGPADEFERRGLDWVIALARVELAAMRSAFGNDRDAFQTLRPSAYEIRAYEELLIDSMRLHLWGLQADPLFVEKNLRQAAVGNEYLLLIYERRVRLTLAFLDAARQFLGARATASQRSEIQQYGDKLAEIHAFIRRELRLGEMGKPPSKATGTDKRKTEPAKAPLAPAGSP
jgi:hypothetical protein